MSLFKRCAHRGRQRDDCADPWWSKLVLQGIRHQISLERHFKQPVRGRGSKTLAKALESDLRSFLASAMPLPTSLTFAEFALLYKTNYVDLKALSSWEGDRKYKVARYVREWGSKPLSSLTLEDIETLLASLKRDSSSASTVRRWYAPLHHMLGWAELRGYLDRSPIGRKGAIQLESEDNTRTRRPSVAELSAIRRAADPLILDMIDVALATGLRQGTLRKLLGGYLDLAPRPKSPYGLFRIPGRHLKNRKVFVVPIPSAATLGILSRRLAAVDSRPDAYIFGNEVGELLGQKHIWDRWDATLCNAGLKRYDDAGAIILDPDLRFHDLRAEFASRLVEAGEPLHRIQRLLGHSTLLMTQRYLRARLGDGFEDIYDTDPTHPAAEVTQSAHDPRAEATKLATPLKLVRGQKPRN